MTKKQPMKAVRAWAVVKRGELKKCNKGEWVLPIMLDKTMAFGYAMFHKDETVVPVLITPIKNPIKR